MKTVPSNVHWKKKQLLLQQQQQERQHQNPKKNQKEREKKGNPSSTQLGVKLELESFRECATPINELQVD